MVPFPFAYTSKLNRRPTPFFGGSRSPQVTKEVQTATPQKGEPCVSQGEQLFLCAYRRKKPADFFLAHRLLVQPIRNTRLRLVAFASASPRSAEQ